MNSKKRKVSKNYELGSRNVYADLGFPLAEDMLIKAQLVTKIAEILDEMGYSQSKAAAILGLTQPKLSRLLRGQFRGFSERKLMDCLTRLGRDVQIVIKSAPKARSQGSVSIVFT
jgi:predicted XRE-type DNA-binding protein